MRMPLILLTLIGLGFSCRISDATTMAKLDLAALTSAAQLVVQVRCEGVEAKWERGVIWSFAEFRVLDTLKGSAIPGQQLVVRVAGGQVGHVRSKVDGAPEFAKGEIAILFLERTSAGDWGISGWSQGTFRIVSDAKGRTTVKQDSSELMSFDRSSKRFEREGAHEMEIPEFKRKVKELSGR